MADENERAAEENAEPEQGSLPIDEGKVADVAARIATAEARAANAESRVAAIEQQQREAAEKAESQTSKTTEEVTPDVVQAAIDEGRISEAQGRQLLVQQEVRKSESAIEERIQTKLDTTAREERITEQKEAYYELKPSLNDINSADFKAAQAEYAYLTKKLGQPEDPSTEVAAFRNVFGSVDNLRASRPREREAFNESGGSGYRSNEPVQDDGIPEELKNNSMMLSHYKRGIEKGMYSGFDDPKLLAEMKYVRNPQ